MIATLRSSVIGLTLASSVALFSIVREHSAKNDLHHWQNLTQESLLINDQTLAHLNDCIALVEGTKK